MQHGPSACRCGGVRGQQLLDGVERALDVLSEQFSGNVELSRDPGTCSGRAGQRGAASRTMAYRLLDVEEVDRPCVDVVEAAQAGSAGSFSPLPSLAEVVDRLHLERDSA